MLILVRVLVLLERNGGAPGHLASTSTVDSFHCRILVVYIHKPNSHIPPFLNFIGAVKFIVLYLLA